MYFCRWFFSKEVIEVEEQDLKDRIVIVKTPHVPLDQNK